MKKTVYAVATALLLAGSLTSCDKKLDITPVNNVSADDALKTSSDVEAALVGCYTGLQNDEAYGGYFQLMSDLLADNGEISFVGTYTQPIQISRKAILKDNSFVQNMWTNAYNVINRTNNVLANIDKLDTQAKKDRVEGEARFIRGAMYFELVKLYAKDWNDGSPSTNPGVPLVLTPTKVLDATAQVKRNTVAEVYAQVITDLTTAETKMKATSAAGAFFANTYAAAGMLSRVYLQQAQFPLAAAAANRAIAGNYTLTPSYAGEFHSGSSNTAEDIFAIQISAQSGSNELNTFYSANRRGDVDVEDKHLAQYSLTDDRRKLFTVSSGQRYSNKFDELYGNIKVIRLAEMLLTRAEANFRAGTVVGATPLADVNRVRARAGLAPLVTLTLPAILLERKLELAFEGFRLADVKRNKESVTDPKGEVLPWNSTRLIFPIPLREINVNPNLEQNEGYK
ncbi:RagB/SusD family nutrient uptake outer membrane protein [Hymenobacter sp. BT770]|uniref:RagB/SusD family nutrient uptake outer membrane protein n=1 Tax=Hymenobacter sp. BT770 TaxID=2886942 RepID=UPI001D113D19|nr:RagB/SusD family nutrient uptake outer membrane protein [Hymenobacter sp. BT770]MCC3152647.1 RagB/SusD family nutrient uptake outer membrane protein [Hymenobacter sp. BT770]MDO3414720.1 RagB/SusD family nutrient uptake outer membrane protein [Hymenobacter sp. BT770]